MKKKIYSILLIICMLVTSMFTLSGCNLLHDNSKRYYDEAVIKVGDEIITRSEVITAFNQSYYNQGLYQYGYSTEFVYERVVESLIKNTIIEVEAKKVIKLEDSDKNAIWKSVIEYINSQINTYEDEIRSLLEAEEREGKDDSTETLYVYKTYEEQKQGEPEEIVTKNKEAQLTEFYETVKKENNYYRYLAYRKYLSELKRSAELYDKNVGSVEDVFEKELNRLYEHYESSKYVTLYWSKLEEGVTVTDEQVQAEYQRIINQQKQQHVSSGAYDSVITGTSNENLILYAPSDANKYFAIQHILLKFDDYDDELKSSSYVYYEAPTTSSSQDDPAYDEYLEIRNNYAEKSGSLNIDYYGQDGKLVEVSSEDYDTEYAKFKDALNTLQSEFNASGKTETDVYNLMEGFFELKYKYSKDSNVTSLDNVTNLIGYVFNADGSTADTYMEEFSDAAYELYEAYQNGEYKVVSVVTNYGVHYMICTGEVGYKETEDHTILQLPIAPVTSQTVYDFIYDSLLESAKSDMQTNTISNLYNKYVNEGLIKKYFKEYSDIA